MVSKISYMKFIDDQVTEFFFGLRDITPVKGILYNSCMVGVIPADSPGSLTGNGSGVRIQKDVVLVKRSPFSDSKDRHAVGILKFFDIKSIDDHGIDISDLVEASGKGRTANGSSWYDEREEAHRKFRRRYGW